MGNDISIPFQISQENFTLSFLLKVFSIDKQWQNDGQSWAITRHALANGDEGITGKNKIRKVEYMNNKHLLITPWYPYQLENISYLDF